MNILYIEHYAGSTTLGMEYRPFYMAREWAKLGHNVTIVAADYTHLRKQNPNVTKSFTEQTVDGVNFVWVKTRRYNGNGVGRIINIYQFISKVKRKAKFLAKRYAPDVVIASSTYPLDIYCSQRIAKKANAKLVFELHDLWPMTPMVMGGLKPSHPVIRVLQKAEDTAFRESNFVISILPNADKHMIERGFTTEKFHYVPNGVIISESEVTTSSEPQIAELKALRDDGWFIVAYTGNHSDANDLQTLINAAQYLRAERIKLVLVGKGNVKSHLQKLAFDKGYNNVMFLEPVEKGSMNALLEQVDVAYMGLKRDPLFSYGISPNKLYDYMLSRKPIIYAVEASNDPVSAAQCGVSVTPGESRHVADVITQLMAMPKSSLQQMGDSGYNFVVEHHDYPVLAKQFIDIIKQEV